MIIKVLVVFFVIFAIWRTLLKLKKQELRIGEAIVWVVFWLAVAVVAITPQTTDIIAQFVGVSRGIDLLVYVSIIVLFFLIFKLIVKLEKIERSISKITRHIALKESDEGKEEKE
ncbi:DUF2304 domain-containing protein [Patescibacteria group bacterium]|nr:DUF2304 domain-containing protein [Patescibacteria group bacterium]